MCQHLGMVFEMWIDIGDVLSVVDFLMAYNNHGIRLSICFMGTRKKWHVICHTLACQKMAAARHSRAELVVGHRILNKVLE
jgi:hypothetical protein